MVDEYCLELKVDRLNFKPTKILRITLKFKLLTMLSTPGV
jgi:hypothetical protein